MFSNVRAAILIPFAMSLAACASISSLDFEKAPYYEASRDDKNRAPQFLIPPSEENGGVTTLDPLYLRTQADYYYSLGEAYSLDGNSSKAIESFKMTMVYDQESGTVNMRLAAEYLKLGMISESLSQAEEAVKKNPKSVDAHLLLGGLYSSIKSYPKALREYQIVMKLQPENTEAPLYIGALYSEQKQFDVAVKYFEYLAKNPDYPSAYLAYYYMGRIRAEQGGTKNEKLAEESFKKSTELKPEFPDAVLALGALYTKQNQEAKAIEMFKLYQKENSPSAKIAEFLAQKYIDAGDYQNAYEQFEYIENDSDDTLNVRMKMALILIEQKKYESAAKKLEQVLIEAQDSDKVRFYLAAVYEEMHQSENAIREYKKIPAISSYYGEAVVHATYLLKGQGKLSEAVELISSALKERQDQPTIYAMYASLLDEKSDYNKAAKILEQGLEKFPDNPQLRFYYGTISDRLGDKEAVVREMKKVLEIDPNHVQGLNYLAFTWAEMNTNLKEAELMARKALELEPKDGYVLDTLGWILYKGNKFSEAIKYLEVAQKYQSNVSIIAEHLGDAYYKQSMVEKAKVMYRKAADLETDQKKAEEIRTKIFAIEKQYLVAPRLPASDIEAAK